MKVTVSDLLTTTAYYTKNNNTIISFSVYKSQLTEIEDSELQDIIKTLKFK